MKNKIISCDEFAKISFGEYGEDIIKSKEYKIYDYYKELDTIYEIYNPTDNDMDLYYNIPGLSHFFNSDDDIYIYTQCNYYDFDTYKLGFSVIKGEDLSEFISNYGGSFFNNYPIIIDFANNSGFFYRSEYPYGNDICIFRDYTNIKKKYLYRKLVNLFNIYNVERYKKI